MSHEACIEKSCADCHNKDNYTNFRGQKIIHTLNSAVRIVIASETKQSFFFIYEIATVEATSQ
jgi:hypothetical protein